MRTLKERLLQQTERGALWQKEKQDGVRCYACGHRCFIPKGFDGICKVRSNVEGELRVPWGYTGGVQVDPIEKKPFYHVLPGSLALSFGMLGCDFHCAYCQNWFTSQALRDKKATARPDATQPEQLVKLAVEQGAKVITSTYNEPLITSEWAVDIFKVAKTAGLYTSYVSNGNATPEVLEYIRPWVDFYKVDLKGFRDKPYRQLGGVLQNILDSIEQIHKMGFWLEIVTLLVPGFNDDEEEIKDLTQFIAALSPDIPWHVTAFHKDYKMQENENTSSDQLLQAAELGKEAGLKFIYAGNRPGSVHNWENTHCSNCGSTLVERKGFQVVSNRMNKSGTCPDCSTVIPGVW